MIIVILLFFFFLSIIHSQNRSLIEYPYNQHELLIRRNRFSFHSIKSTRQKVNLNTQLNSTMQCPSILHYPSYSSPKHCYSHLQGFFIHFILVISYHVEFSTLFLNLEILSWSLGLCIMSTHTNNVLRIDDI